MKNLKASLPATMAGIASKAGLKLAFGQPRTDGKTIWVSDIPLNPSIDDYNSVVSDLIHEVGHILYTEFSVDRSGHTLLPLLTNVFEDVRIEKALEKEFLGAATFLNEGYKVVMGNGQNRKPDTPANALGMYLLLKYMIDVNGRSFFAESRDEALAALFDFGVRRKLIEEIVALCDPRVPSLSSVEDVLELSWDVIELLEDAKKEDEQPEPEESPEDDSQSDPENGDDSDDDSSDDSGDDSSDSDSSSNDAADSSDDSQQESNGTGSPGEDDNASESTDESGSSGCSKGGAKELLESDVDDGSPISLREAAEEVANETLYTESAYGLYGNTHDLAQELKSLNGSGSSYNYYANASDFRKNLAAYNRIKSSVFKDSQVLRNRLVKRWQNESRTRNVINEHDGRFSASEAIRCMSSGEQDFLVKRSKKVNNKPAVCLLGDLSDSMLLDGRLAALKETMVALAETCSMSQVPLNVLGFSDYVLPLKKWNEPMAKARGLIGATDTICGTEIVKAVFEGIRALSKRKESKKILIVMTDGQIDNINEVRLNNLIEYTARHHPDIEIFGLGIGISIDHIFPKGGRVDRYNMAQTVLNILSK